MNRITIEDNEEYLRSVSLDVDFNDKTYLDDIKKLEKYCTNSVVFAMAAIQLGIPKRIIYLRNTTPNTEKNFDNSYNERKIFINPIVKCRIGHTRFLERCASCLDNSAVIDRPYIIKVEYYNIDGKKVSEVLEGFETTVFSHEYDHLDGILHMDLAKEVWQFSMEEAIWYRNKNPYEIVSKDCEFDSIKK